jgi:hypothetical protein
MYDQLITLETAKLAKEKGFNLVSPAWYGCDDPQSGEPNQLFLKDWVKFSDVGILDIQNGTEIYSASTQSQLQKWLREIHHIDVIPIPNVLGYGVLIYCRYPTKEIHDKNLFETFEEALEAGLKIALKLN